MTRKSRREIEHDVEDLTDGDDTAGPDRLVIHRTVVGTSYNGSDLEEGETETTEQVIEL